MDVIVIIAFALTVTGAQESQLEGPENTLSFVGSNVTLKCSSPSRNCHEIDWMKYIPGGSSMAVFKKDRGGILGAYRDRYSVDNSSSCDLVIRNVELSDAGRFICSTIISSNTIESSAYLIILKIQPLCKINASLNETVEGDGVQLTCEVTYNATNRASMLWKGAKDAPAAVENGKTISRSYSVDASAPEVPSFTCVTSFATDNNGTMITGLATNIPSTTCETPAIKVLYSVRHVNLSPSFAVYSIGTVITCMAKGYPAPTFKWQMMATSINETWQDIPYATHHLFAQYNVSVSQYRCVATNVVRGERYTANSTAFKILQSDEINSTKINFSEDCLGVGIGIGLLVAILLASITFVILVRLGYLEFHPRPANKPLDGATQQMDQEISSSSRQLSATYSLVRRTEAPLVEEQESAYASLAQDRAANEYASLQQKEEARHEKSPETPDLNLYSTAREI